MYKRILCRYNPTSKFISQIRPLLNGAAISWRASRTTLIVLNAAEAELYSLSSATQEAIYLHKVWIELGFLQYSPAIVYEDFQTTVALSKENKFRNHSKHISLRWSFVVERLILTIGDIAVVGISRSGMLADIFCTPRPASSFIPFRNTILGHPQMPITLLPTEERDASGLLDHGSCRLWIPNGSLPCSPIYWHAVVMQNTTIVWLSINLMCNLSSKVFARKIWNLLGLIFFPFPHIHRHALVMQNTTIMWLSTNLTCNLSYKAFTNLTLMVFTFPPEFMCDHQI